MLIGRTYGCRRVWIAPLSLLAWLATVPIGLAAEPTGPAPSPAGGKSGAANDILNMDLEQLAQAPVVVPSMDIPVTSVSKEASTVGHSAAAIFVITNDMIRRSGATCVPEALRMAPGLEVARVNSNTWAITSRGSNNAFANKLLVMIDGRTIYCSAFSGVYWDSEDVLLEDVDRIEVIRGPGGTLWGANAVNGVINILTKQAKDTQGSYVSAGGGTVERSMGAARYGGEINEDCHYRVYAKYNDRGSFYNPDDFGNDAWNHGQAGFRADWDLDKCKIDSLTIQGDHYVGTSGNSYGWCQPVQPYQQNFFGTIENTGDNVLARWRHVYDEDSDLTLQTYFDNFERDTLLNSARIKTWDLELQYRFALSERHQITCGAGYRHIHDELPTTNLFTLGVIPTERTTYIANQFVQDEITLSPELLQLTLGCKLEQNSYTFLEYQPTIRMLYTPDKRHSGWGAVSRAVHTPSRVDEDLFATTETDMGFGPWFLRSTGNPNERSETLLAYELGWREQMTDKFAWDVATFYNSYDDLRTLDYTGFSPGPPTYLYYQFGNAASAQSYGVELAATYAASERWNLYVQYTYLQMHVYDDAILQGDGNSPCNQVYLKSSWNVRENVDFDLMARYVDRLVGLSVPSYIEMDLRLAWRPRKHLELAVVGQNLLETYHYEFGRTTETFSSILTETPRGVYGTVNWRY